MRRVHLTTLLIALNLGLLILAAAGVAWLARDLFAQSAVNPQQAQSDFVSSLILWGLAVALLIILANFLTGRQLSRPLQRLANDATRIGYGDLAAPIAPASGDELAALAAALEDMRARLLNLTVDLRRQQSESDAILTGIVEGVFAVDRERRLRYLNPQAAALLGLSPAQALGRFCGDVLNPQGAGGVRPCEEQCPIVHARFRAGASA